MESTRKKRKKRVKNLLNKWCDEIEIAIKKDKFNEDMLQRMFKMFCIRENINRPQDKTLRENILIKSTIELERRGYKNKREEELKK